MTTQLTDQIRSLASDVDAASQEPAMVPMPSEAPRRRRVGGVAFAAACVVLFAGVIAIAALGGRTSGEDEAPDAVADTEPELPVQEVGVDPEVEALVAAALADAPPHLHRSTVPIGEPWEGQIWTSDGPVDGYLARTVGQAADGEGFCDGGCYGAGWSDPVPVPRLTGGGSRDPVVISPDLMQIGPDPVMTVRWLLPEGTAEVTITWPDGTQTMASAVQPFGPGTPTITAVKVPPGATGGTIDAAGQVVEFLIPPMRSADELIADIRALTEQRNE